MFNDITQDLTSRSHCFGRCGASPAARPNPRGLRKINNNNNLASCFPPEHIPHYSFTQTKYSGPLQIISSILFAALDFYLGIIFKDFPNKSLAKHMSALWQGWQIFPELELNLKMEIGLINDFRWKKRGGFQHRAEMKHNARSNSWRRSSEGSASQGVGEQEGAGRSREEQGGAASLGSSLPPPAQK